MYLSVFYITNKLEKEYFATFSLGFHFLADLHHIVGPKSKQRLTTYAPDQFIV